MGTVERANEWLMATGGATVDMAMFGAPIGKSSISPSQGWTTPPAFRAALSRFPTWDATHHLDVSSLTIRDLGDVDGDEMDTDSGQSAHERIREFAKHASTVAPIVVIVGGDNSLTRPALIGFAEDALSLDWGLVTLDAHHDTRQVVDGISRNGTPVRELIEAGLPGSRVAQIGIHAFGNSRSVSEWAYAAGIHIATIEDARSMGMAKAVANALDAVRSAGAKRIYFDLDVDVVDRAFAPGCPASMPGGLLPADAATVAFLMGEARDVVAMDLAEVDASMDVAGMTVRLMGELFMNFCSGVVSRSRSGAEQ